MKITQLRKEKGVTQDELAQRCNTTQQQIARIEKGLVDPKVSTIIKIADALDCDISELFISKTEFLREINGAIKAHHLNMKKLDLTRLNTICAVEKRVPAFHPYWERVVLTSNGTVKYKENEK